MNLLIERFLMNLEEYGNIFVVSILFLLDEYKINNFEVKRVILVGFGGGFIWGVVILNV